jgi:hypothetical protein
MSEKRLPPDARNDTTRVRQGRTLGTMRWVLLVSLVTVVVALAVAFAVVPMS